MELQSSSRFVLTFLETTIFIATIDLVSHTQPHIASLFALPALAQTTATLLRTCMDRRRHPLFRGVPAISQAVRITKQRHKNQLIHPRCRSTKYRDGAFDSGANQGNP